MIIEQKELGKKPVIHENTQLKEVSFEDYNEIGVWNFIENTHFGSFSYTGQFCFVQNAEIGKFANIAANVRIGPTAHPYDRPSLHHFTYRPAMYGFSETDDSVFFEERCSRKAVIGHDTWIGHGAIIMPEVTIGNGAIVGAGAVVTKDVPPYSIVTGIPATVVKYRFPEEIQEALEAIKWWHWSPETIKERLADFQQPIEVFVEKYHH